MKARIKALKRIVGTWLTFAGVAALFESPIDSHNGKRKKKENR